MTTDSGRGSTGEAPEQYNMWRFLTEFSQGFFSLINSGRVFPAFGLAILVILGIVAWRVPESDLADLIEQFFEILSGSELLLWTALIVTNGVWLYIVRRVRRQDQAEIERLTDVRSELVHGREEGELEPIERHRSSEDDQTEEYIIPGRAHEAPSDNTETESRPNPEDE